MTMPDVLAYEDQYVMRPLVEALVKTASEGELVIFRAPFRWKMVENKSDPVKTAHVISNAYEMFDLEQVADERNWEILYNFTHAAIVRPKERVAS